MSGPDWWSPPWVAGSEQDPDSGWNAHAPYPAGAAAWHVAERLTVPEDSPLAPLEAEYAHFRSRDRVRDLAEVFTHEREVHAMLDLIPDAFHGLDVKFLEASCGSGNFLTEVLRRKLRLVRKAECFSQEQYEHQLLRVLASIYGVDISPENVTEARARMAHLVLEHFQMDANTVEPTAGFMNAVAVVLDANVVLGDTLNAPDRVELCDWQPHPGGRFRRLWSFSLVPEDERDLFWSERVQDREPVHYSSLVPMPTRDGPTRRKSKAT